MQHYLVEPIFALAADSLAAAADDPARAALLAGTHRAHHVCWLRSYLTPDRRRSFCLVEAASPEAVRLAAVASGLPVDRLCEVRTIDAPAGSLCSPSPQESA